jgi:hypothetical protein
MPPVIGVPLAAFFTLDMNVDHVFVLEENPFLAIKPKTSSFQELQTFPPC